MRGKKWCSAAMVRPQSNQIYGIPPIPILAGRSCNPLTANTQHQLLDRPDDSSLGRSRTHFRYFLSIASKIQPHLLQSRIDYFLVGRTISIRAIVQLAILVAVYPYLRHCSDEKSGQNYDCVAILYCGGHVLYQWCDYLDSKSKSWG